MSTVSAGIDTHRISSGVFRKAQPRERIETREWTPVPEAGRRYEPIVIGDSVDPRQFEEADADERWRTLLHIENQVDRYPDEVLQALVEPSLCDSDPDIRGWACRLVSSWSEIHKQKAAQFEPRLRRMAQHDSNEWVCEQATEAVRRLSTISDDNTIDLDLFKVADAYRKMQVLQEVSQCTGAFDAKSVRTLIDCALHDADPLIRGAACNLLQEQAATDAWRWTRFEPQVRQMAFQDPNPWVCKQAIAVTQRLYWPVVVQRSILLCATLAVILSLVAFSMIADALPASWAIIPSSCDEHPYAHSVVQATGTDNASYAIGAPNGAYASVGLEANSVLTLDMGQDTPIVTGPGVGW